MDKRLIKIIKIVIIIIGGYFLYLLLPGIEKVIKYVMTIILPFLLGFAFAYILMPIVEWLTKIKINRKLSVFLVVGFFVIVIISINIFLIPRIVSQLSILLENIPIYIDNISLFLDRLSTNLSFLPLNIQPTPDNVQVFLTNRIGYIFESLLTLLQNSLAYVLVILITPIIMIYFLLEFNKIKNIIKEWLIKKEKIETIDILSEIDVNLRAYCKGILIVMTLLTIISTFCFRIIGIDLPLLWGIIIGITNIIPYIGPYLGGAIVIIFSLTSTYEKTFLVLLSIIVLQLLESNFLTPAIQSKMIKTSPLMVLLFLAVFGKIMGIIGMLLAIPILNIIQIIVRKKIIMKKNN